MPTPLKRQIGYKKPAMKKEEKAPIKAAPKKPEIKSKAPVGSPGNPPTAKDLYQFLKDRPLIKIGPLCESVNMDRSNFCTYMGKGRELPQETVDKFVEALRLYGWK